MKQNKDLLREILLRAEEHCDGVYNFAIQKNDLDEKFHDITLVTLTDHIVQLKEGGLIDVKRALVGYEIIRLTYRGHALLDDARDLQVWEAAKKVAGNKSFPIFCGTLSRLAGVHGLGKLDDVLFRLCAESVGS